MSSSDSDSSFDENKSSSGEENEDTTDNEVEEENEVKDDEEEDEIIKKFRVEQEKKRNHPPDVQFDDHVVDICFHPDNNLIAVANIVGDVILCTYSNDETVVSDTWEVHTKACRDIEFNHSGNVLYSTSKDKSIVATDVSTGRFQKCIEEAHETSINCLIPLDEHCIATGDDDGLIRFWDLRKNDSKPIYQTKKHDDYISDMVVDDNRTYLVASSGDGSISSIDLKNRSFFLQSEQYEEEFTSLGLFRHGSKLLASTNKGKMFLFNWHEFGYHSDEFPGPKQPINSLVPITENIVVTANEDGILRGTNLFPHRQLGVVGQHSMSVDCLDISNDGTLIASCSYQNDLKFWNISYFAHFQVHTPKKKENKKLLFNNLPSSKQTNRKDFFSDLGS